MQLCRFTFETAHARIGYIDGNDVYDITARFPSITAFLRWSIGRADAGSVLRTALAGSRPLTQLSSITLLRPSDDQEIWAAGVTYERSRVAREEESANSGIYDRVYTAARPEIFFKATPSRVVGPHEPVAIRHDASWNVPEPELALVVNPAMEIVGYTIGNDMSSRDIEGENPLYLPQAKMYGRCCAVGPTIALCEHIANPNDLTISISIQRAGAEVFQGSIHTSKIVRRFTDLVAYLGRDNVFPDGAFLLTGTGIVPPDSFTLESGDQVEISISGIGTLRNPVVRGG